MTGTKPARQLARVGCSCGTWAVVERGYDPWTFVWTCGSCGATDVINWPYNQPAPYFEEPLKLPFEGELK